VFRVTLRQLPSFVVVVFIVVVLTFLLLQAAPGDPAAHIAGADATAEQVQQVRQQLGLNAPLLSQLWKFTRGALTFHFGTSLVNGQPVTKLILEALPPTLSLAILSLGMAIIVGFLGGTIAALRQGRLADRVVSWTSAVGLAVPPFVFGFILVIVFAVGLRWFPAVGYTGITVGFAPWLNHLILPAIAIALHSAPEIARQVRGSLADTLHQDFIRTKTASGLSSWAVVGKHALRNSAIPVLTVVGLQTSRILAGVVTVENVFAIPGLGSLAYRSVVSQDYPTIQGVVLISSFIVLAVNLLVDLSYPFFNPRLRP
jgi:peptide/nickel transport system permease protein